MIFDIRFGTADDTAMIAEFILEAGGGIFEQLFEGVLPRVAAGDLLAMTVADEASPLGYANAVLAEAAGQVCGMALSYPAADYGLPTIARTIVPRHRLAVVRDVLASRIDDSFYVNSLYVASTMRGHGLSKLLLETVSELAAAQGFTTLSLHAWGSNVPAMRLYEQLGFERVRSIPVPPSEFLRYRGPMVLMRSPLLLKEMPPPSPAAASA